MYKCILLRWRHGRSAAVCSCRWTDVWHECYTWTIMCLISTTHGAHVGYSFESCIRIHMRWRDSWEHVTQSRDLNQTYENDETCVNDVSETYENIVSFIGLFCKRDRRHSRCVTDISEEWDIYQWRGWMRQMKMTRHVWMTWVSHMRISSLL